MEPRSGLIHTSQGQDYVWGDKFGTKVVLCMKTWSLFRIEASPGYEELIVGLVVHAEICHHQKSLQKFDDLQYVKFSLGQQLEWRLRLQLESGLCKLLNWGLGPEFECWLGLENTKYMIARTCFTLQEFLALALALLHVTGVNSNHPWIYRTWYQIDQKINRMIYNHVPQTRFPIEVRLGLWDLQRDD